jgi:hypothetical protein
MASAKVVWSIKERAIVCGPVLTSQEASDALRKHLSKMGTTTNDKGTNQRGVYANYELLTVTI